MTIEGEHVADVFVGQLFTQAPGADVETFFRNQARHFGFDESAYMSAFREIPVLEEDRFRPVLGVLAQFAELVAKMGFARLRERAAITEQLAMEARLLELEREGRTEAERANGAKDVFLAMVSHELRTPLSTILLRVDQLLRRNPEPEPTRKALEAIRRSAKDQAQLVEDLLDVARIAKNKLDLRKEPVALAPLVEAAVDMLHAEAAERGVRLEARIDPHSGTVDGEARRLKQIVTNLLSNALKFTPAGGRVSVELGRLEDCALLRVTDTGVGIDADDLPKLFTRFYQSERSSTQAKGGLGLGLAVVRDLVGAHGGTVEARSPGRGQGATFTVSLPLRLG